MDVTMLSVIIPTLNSGSGLETLLQGVGRGADIVVADGGSTDRTVLTAITYGARIAAGGPGRGAQLSRGARWASGAWLLFLHSDCVLPENWQEVCANHIESRPQKAGYFSFKLDSPRLAARIVEWGVNLRCLCRALPYGDQGLLISKEHYEEVGGYPDWPLFEDVKIIQSIGRKRLRSLRAPLLTSAEKYQSQGYFKRVWQNRRLLRRYLRGAKPQDLARDYSR